MSPYVILVVVVVGLALIVGIALAVDRASVARARASTDREWLDLCRFTLKHGTVDDLKAVAEVTRPRRYRPWIIQVNDLPPDQPSSKDVPRSLPARPEPDS